MKHQSNSDWRWMPKIKTQISVMCSKPPTIFLVLRLVLGHKIRPQRRRSHTSEVRISDALLRAAKTNRITGIMCERLPVLALLNPKS